MNDPDVHKSLNDLETRVIRNTKAAKADCKILSKIHGHLRR